MRAGALACAAALIISAHPFAEQTGAAKAAELAAVLERVGRYVNEYQARLAGVVAEETYKQDVRTASSARPGATSHRELKSDLLLVRPAADGPWLQFRDVFEVDGKPVRDRDDRLLKLFVDTKLDFRGQAEAIALEGSRYNIGPVQRTINVPVLALVYFGAAFQERSKFLRVSAGNVKRFAAVPTTSEVWAIEFREVGAPTLIRGAKDSDLPAKGRAWIETGTGRVLATELNAEDQVIRAKIEVTYGVQPGLDLLVPIQMKEAYVHNFRIDRIFGEASYGRFRQFKVTTEEKTGKPPGQ